MSNLFNGTRPHNLFERLESRALFTATVGTLPVPTNLSHAAGQQLEPVITVDPTNPARLFAASDESGSSLFTAVSADAGQTWSTRVFADGTSGFPTAFCDPSAAFDQFGNLFFAYTAKNGHAELLLSTDGGQNFTQLKQFAETADQSTVAVGPGPGGKKGAGSVWVAFQEGNGVLPKGALAYGTAVDGLGKVRPFKKPRRITGPPGQNVGDISVGPRGQVMVAYQTPGTRDAPGTISVRVDPDGLGSKKFGKPIVVGTTNVGDFDAIPAQPHRTIDAAVALAFDRSGGPFTGRAYMVYTDESPDESSDTDVLLRYSDDGGASWSDPQRVNDDATANSQFLPRLAVDQATGNVAVDWYDSRNDLGIPGQGSTNAIVNDQAEFYGAVGSPSPGGVDFSSNFRIQPGVSDAASDAAGHANNLNDYGDYTAMAFHGGALYPTWSDNSNSAGDNPDGAGAAMDVYASKLTVQSLPEPDLAAPTAELTSAPPRGRRGKRYKLTIAYAPSASSSAAIDRATLGNANVMITGQDGFAQSAVLKKVTRKRGVLYATYAVTLPPAPRGTLPGPYTIALQPSQVGDAAGHFAAGRSRFATFTA